MRIQGLGLGFEFCCGFFGNFFEFCVEILWEFTKNT